MRVAFVTFRYPLPVDRGDRITSFHTLEAFSTRHQVDVYCAVERTPAQADREKLQSLVARQELDLRTPWERLVGMVSAFLTGRPLQVGLFGSERLTQAFARAHASRPYDCVISHSIRMASIFPHAAGARKILFGVDCLTGLLSRLEPFSPAWKRPLVALERSRVRRAESELTGQADEVWLISESDVQDWPALDHSRVRLVRQGVAMPESAAARNPVPGRMLFVGRLDTPPNEDAVLQLVLEILPSVRARLPHAHVRIVGGHPTSRVRALASHAGVELAGYVSEVAAEYLSASVLVAPLRFSAGMQNKLLEAMDLGLPVVTTPVGARGISPEFRERLRVAPDAPSLVALAIACLEHVSFEPVNPQFRKRLRSVYNWDRVLEALEHPFPAGGERQMSR